MKIKNITYSRNLRDEVLTLTTCIKLSLRDGTIIGFTERSEDILIDKVLYKKTVASAAA